MECEWSVDEIDGCTLRLQCKMKDACDKDECFDLETLVAKAVNAPRYFTDSKLISGPQANYTNECSVKYGKICPSTEPTAWTDYLPDTTPIVESYIYPVYSSIGHVLYNYVFLPLLNWVFTPVYDYVFTPVTDYIIYPVWSYFTNAAHSGYELLPDADMYTLEFLIHFLACVFTVTALFIVLFVYFCYVFTDRAKFGVVTRHPLKEHVTNSNNDGKDDQQRRNLPKSKEETKRTPQFSTFLSAGAGSHDYEANRRLNTAVERDQDRERRTGGGGGWYPRQFFSGMGARRRRSSSHDLHRKLTQIAQSFDRPRNISGSLAEEDDDRPLYRRYSVEEEREMDVDHMARNACILQ